MQMFRLCLRAKEVSPMEAVLLKSVFPVEAVLLKPVSPVEAVRLKRVAPSRQQPRGAHQQMRVLPWWRWTSSREEKFQGSTPQRSHDR